MCIQSCLSVRASQCFLHHGTGLKLGIGCHGWLVVRDCVLHSIPLGFLSAKHTLPNLPTFHIQGTAESLVVSVPSVLKANILVLPLPASLLPTLSWWPPVGPPHPLLQGEIGHHPFSPLGTRNPCVYFPVKGLPSPEVTQKSTVWLQPVTASAGRTCVCAHSPMRVRTRLCVCVHTNVCTCMPCVHVCA